MLHLAGGSTLSPAPVITVLNAAPVHTVLIVRSKVLEFIPISAVINPSLSIPVTVNTLLEKSPMFKERPANCSPHDGCCTFCDDAAEAANDLQRLILPPLQASVISVGRCIAQNHWLSEQMQKMRDEVLAKNETIRADIAAKNEQCQDLEDINVATIAENQELQERLEDKKAEIRDFVHSEQKLVQEMNRLKRRDSDLCTKICSLVRAEQDLVEELKNSRVTCKPSHLRSTRSGWGLSRQKQIRQ